METMKHECYVSLEVAKLLKEAGFDWECDKFYDCTNSDCARYEEYSAPTLEIAQRWLREVKKLDISIHYDPTIKSQPYVYSMYDVEEKFDDILGIISPVTHSYSDGYFYTYEEAQEAGIKKAVEIILEKGE